MESKVFKWFRNDVKVSPFKKTSATTATELDTSTAENDKDVDDSRKSEDQNDLPSPDSNSVSEPWEEACDGVSKSSVTPVSALDISCNDFSDLSINLGIVKNSPSLQLGSSKKFIPDQDIRFGSKSSSFERSQIVSNHDESPTSAENDTSDTTAMTRLQEIVQNEAISADHLQSEKSPDTFNGSDANVLSISVDSNLNDVILDNISKQLPNCEVEFANGSDSGVETNGKYFKELEIEVSCNSSQISRCSSPYQFDSEELLSSCSAANSQTLHFSDTHTSLDYNYGEGTSEAGSESSCITGSGSLKDAKISLRKKTGNEKNAVSRSRPPFSTNSSNNSPRETGRKSIHFTTSNVRTSTVKQRETSESRGTKSTRSLSSTRSKLVPAVDDGRWPYSNKSHITVSRQKSSTPHANDKKSPAGYAAESKANSQVIEKYATLPRRRRQKSNENLTNSHDSSSRHRDQSLNKSEILRRKHRETNLMTSSLTSNCKTLPPYPGVKPKVKTKKYLETCTQTCFTSNDIEQLVAGNPVTINVHQAETMDASLQVNFRNDQIETLQSLVKQLKEDLTKYESENATKKQELNKTKRELESYKLTADMIQQQFKAYEERVCNLLLKRVSDVSGDYLSELERQTVCMNDIVKKQQAEIKTLHHSCSKLQKKLEKNSVAQKSMMQSQQELEMESLEMQDFLQTEKLALSDSIKDLENEVLKQKQLAREKDKELARQKEEYLQLAHVAEQRRQENVVLQSKVNASEQRSKAFLLEQGASVSGASVALSGLGDRLESLIEQLVVAYDISEADLEEVVFHNEAFSRSCSNSDSSPLEGKLDFTISHKNVKLSINKNSSAAQPPEQISNSDPPSSNIKLDTSHSTNKKTIQKLDEDKVAKPHEESSLETENLVPYESIVPDSSCLKKENSNGDLQLLNCESLQNLDHQQLDKVCFEECEDDRFFDELYPNHSLVDQVIEIDNLVAKLLKIFTILKEKENRNELFASSVFQVSEGKLAKVCSTLDQMKHLKTKLQPSSKYKINGALNPREVPQGTSVIVDPPVVLKKVQNNSNDFVPESCHETNSSADVASSVYNCNSSSLNGSS